MKSTVLAADKWGMYFVIGCKIECSFMQEWIQFADSKLVVLCERHRVEERIFRQCFQNHQTFEFPSQVNGWVEEPQADYNQMQKRDIEKI